MPAVKKLRLSLAEAIDIPLWLERDREIPWTERAHRDRAIGRELTIGAAAPVDRVMHWWRALAPESIEPERGRALARLLSRLGTIMVIAGALSGSGIAVAVLRYDGSDPINILVVFGLLVLLPAVFLFASLALPFFPSSSFGGEANLGHIVLGFLKRRHPGFDEFFASRHADQARDSVLRWRFTLSSQQFGLAFSIAALATLLVKTGFSDLAFAWSTTLNIDAQQVQQVVDIIARPWSTWFPKAVPELGLIEQSRYFRLETDSSVLQAATLTTWWQFLALSIATYGVVPRAAALVVSLFRTATAERTLLLSHTEVRALLDRLDAPEIAGTSTTPENPGTAPDVQTAIFDGSTDGDVIIIWNGATTSASVPENTLVIEAGGERSPDDDQKALAQIPRDINGAVRVITKAWEPPLLELHDYLIALREHIGPGFSIVVQPLGVEKGPPEPNDIAVWRASLARLDDPEVYVQ